MVGDAELAIAAGSGDRAALADIYDRYADSLYDLCRAILRDPHEASDALQDTFVIAATRLSQLRHPERLKPWLSAIARHESIRRSSNRARMRPARDEALDVPVMDDTAGGAMADDAASLVWEAANSLTERERALLVLNVRQGLEGADLADAAGMPGPQASVVLSRAKTQLAIAVRCTLLVRRGRTACDELSQIVPKAHHALDGLTRKRVARHAQSCAICEPTWNASPDALGVLGAAPLLGAPAALKSKVLDDPRLISTSRPLGGRGWQRDGFPPADVRDRRRPLMSLAAALIFVVVAGVLVLLNNDDSKTLAAGDRPTTSTTVLGVGAETTLANPSSTTTAPKRTTTTKKATTASTAKPGSAGTTPPPTAAPTTTSTTVPLTITTRGPSTMQTCDPSTFSATTTGPEPEILYLIYSDATGSSGSKNMSKSGSGWVGTLTIPDPGDYTWKVSTSPTGNGTSSNSKSVHVEAC